jgi:hypothetical protein
MFPTRYFADRYFAPRYWPKVGAAVVGPEVERYDCGNVTLLATHTGYVRLLEAYSGRLALLPAHESLVSAPQC